MGHYGDLIEQYYDDLREQDRADALSKRKLQPTDFRKQIDIELIAGALIIPVVARQAIITKVSELCGGCTVMNSMGYWVEEGSGREERYDVDNLQEEDTLHILLTCEEEKFEGIYNDLQRIMAVAKVDFDLDMQWIHCKVSESRGTHFKI